MNILLINYNNGSRWPVLPEHLLVLSDVLNRNSHRVEIKDYNLTKEPYEKLEEILFSYDVVGLGFISGYYQHAEVHNIAKIINKSSYRKQFKFIIGGHAPSAAPEYYKNFLRADTVFTGPAEISLPAWLESGMPDGIVPSKGYDDTPHSYDIDGMNVYKRIRFPATKNDEFAIQLLSGRGCPYQCTFCYRMNQKFLQYDIPDLLDKIVWLAEQHAIRHFQLSDELFMANRKYIEKFCDAVVDVQMKKGWQFGFDCNARLNMAKPDLLIKMKNAGFRYLNFGVEALDNKVLSAMNKKQTVDEVIQGIERTLTVGLSPGINIMWGNLYDTDKTLQKAVEFINNYSDGVELRTIRPVTPYPGSALFDKLLQEGRLQADNSIEYFYKKHVNSDLFSFHWMPEITNEEADKMLYWANMEIFNKYILDHKKKVIEDTKDFYEHLTPPQYFRGWREV